VNRFSHIEANPIQQIEQKAMISRNTNNRSMAYESIESINSTSSSRIALLTELKALFQKTGKDV
jgi:hypothetical protein